MRKVTLLTVCVMMSWGIAQAHDEGHGPKLADSGKYGGLISAVVNRNDAKLGGKATLVYKAELVRSADGTVRVYLYDQTLQPLKMDALEKKGKGIMGAKKKGKFTTQEFEVTLEGNTFTGKMPTPFGKPYNLDFELNEKDRGLLTAFDNLD